MAISLQTRIGGAVRSLFGTPASNRPTAVGCEVRTLRQELHQLRARYDAAQTHFGNENHWAAALGESADAALSPEVRRKLRNRCRYEVENNGWARGIAQTVADMIVGDGPRIKTVEWDLASDPERVLEWEFLDRFQEWSSEVCFGESLWIARLAEVHTGESFALLQRNTSLSARTKLDLTLIEADQVTSLDPAANSRRPQANGEIDHDGVIVDRYGRPRRYRVLKQHPGSTTFVTLSTDSEDITADRMVHLFRRERPGQVRGVPEMVSSLEALAKLRRYEDAVLGAAEMCARLIGAVETASTPEDDEVEAYVTPGDELEMSGVGGTALPPGYKMNWRRAEQPTVQHGDFVKMCVASAARAVHMPRNLALMDSSGANFSSGKLDHRAFFRHTEIDRARLIRHWVTPIFRAWWVQALADDPQFARQMESVGYDAETPPKVQWGWANVEPIDETKAAAAAQVRMTTGVTSLADECNTRGQDWEVVMEQRAKELDRARELGLSLVTHVAPAPTTSSPGPNEDVDEDVDDDDQNQPNTNN